MQHFLLYYKSSWTLRIPVNNKFIDRVYVVWTRDEIWGMKQCNNAGMN